MDTKMEKIFSKFKGLDVIFDRAIKDASLIRNNSEWSEEGKNKRFADIKDKLYLTYSNMIEEAIKDCELGVKDKQEGYKICKLKNITDDSKKLYYLNYYTNLVEKMSVEEIVDFMSKDNNLLNTVYRDCFLTKAEYYKKDLAPLSNTSFKVDEIVSEINFEKVEGLKEFRDMKNTMLNIKNELINFNWIKYKIEYGDLSTHQDVTTLFNLESAFHFHSR